MAFEPNNPNGRAAASASEPIVLSNEDKTVLDNIKLGTDSITHGITTTNASIGATNEAAAASDTATSGTIGLLKRLLQRITTLITNLGSPFQTGGTIGNTAFGVNNSGGASAVNIQDGGNSITVDGAITANAGTNLNTSALALESTQNAQSTLIGSVTETAPTTDTASSGLNGRLQRIAQRLTSLITAIGTPLQAGGTVVANAGTNLNTSALSLESTQLDVKVSVQAITANGVPITDGVNILDILTAGSKSVMPVIHIDSAGNIHEPVSGVGQGAGPSADDKMAIVAGYDVPNDKYRRLNMYDDGGGLWHVYVKDVGLDAINTKLGDGSQITQISNNRITDFRNSSVSLVVTSINSLASSLTACAVTDRVGNLRNAIDILIMAAIDHANTAPSTSATDFIWLVPWYYDGSTWTHADLGNTTVLTGSAQTVTLGTKHNLTLLGVMNYTTTDQVTRRLLSVAKAFGPTMPDGFSILMQNDSGAAYAASGNSLIYREIYQKTIV